jgi:hypothetical protein
MSIQGQQLAFFGNIWVRQNVLLKAGDKLQGHAHNFDHVTLLVKGKVRVSIPAFEPTEFTAPTFIVIKKEFEHAFEALEDDTLWYCVFAMRDVDGEVVDIYGEKNSPYGVGGGNMSRLATVSILP